MSTVTRPSPALINIGAVAILVVSILYVMFWPGPQGLPLIKVGIPQRIISVELSIMGINDADLANTVRKGEKIEVSINSAPHIPMTINTVQALPRTVVSTQPIGTVKPLADPRPEMRFSNNLLISLQGKGYANKNGIFVGLKRARVGATVHLRAPGFDAPGSIVNIIST